MNQGEMILTPEEAKDLLRYLEYRDSAMCPAIDKLMPRIRACAAMVAPPLNGDKVWGGLTTRLIERGDAHRHSHTVVRAQSEDKAARLLGLAGERLGANRIRESWFLTNDAELLRMATEPGVWVKGAEGWRKK